MYVAVHKSENSLLFWRHTTVTL